jgi:hypothetical protein
MLRNPDMAAKKAMTFNTSGSAYGDGHEKMHFYLIASMILVKDAS